MKFLERLGKVLKNNIAYTVVLIAALICFFYFAGDLIAGLFTVVSALVIYICASALYTEYKKTPAGKSVAKKASKKK
jgi:hypothetical protein